MNLTQPPGQINLISEPQTKTDDNYMTRHEGYDVF